MSMNYETLDLHELIHYGELGEIPGIHPTIAKSIREKLEAGSTIEMEGPTRNELEEKITFLEEQLNEVRAVVS
jgi:hypothetical protein